jgi:hypothetical protein
LLDFVLALAGIWPALLIGGAIGAVVWRWRKAKRTKN